MSRTSSAIAMICAASLGAAGPAAGGDATLDALAEAARLAMDGQNWREALDLTSKAVADFGGDDAVGKYGGQIGALFYRKGVCEMKLKRWEDALVSFEVCYRDFPAAAGNPFQKVALLKWGEAAMGAGKWELALSRFSKFVEERDRARDAFARGSFYINLAVCHYKLGHIAEGNENLEIALKNQRNFPAPGSGIVAGFQALAEAASAAGDEQVLLDFIGKNRGELILGPAEMRRYSGVFLKIAGDALAAGMERAAISLYQFVPAIPGDPAGAITLAAVGLIHEKAGNVRGAVAAYEQLELDHPQSANRENHIYQLVRTALLAGENELAELHSGRLARDFPRSAFLDEIRASGLEITVDEPMPMPREAVELEREFSGPPEYAAAVDLFQGRKYVEARAAFREIAADSRGELADLARFHEMECLRKLDEPAELAAAMKSFTGRPALGLEAMMQLEINTLQELARGKNWDRLYLQALGHFDGPLPGRQRAQVAYWLGLTLENLGRTHEAVGFYQVAMTAAAGGAELVTRKAALQVLGIHLANPGEPVEEPAAVARLFKLALGAGAPLPAKFEVFLRSKAGS